MQSLHKKNKVISSTGWISAVKIEENMRKRDLVPTYLRLYHYAGNNPVKYIDPNGKFVVAIPMPVLPPPIIPPQVETNGTMVGGGFYQLPYSSTNTVFPSLPQLQCDKTIIFPNLIYKRQLTMVFMLLVFKTSLILFNQAPGTNAIPEPDKEAIAQHSYDGSHGYEVNFDNPTEECIRQRIDEILSDPNTKVKTRKRDGAKLYMSDDGTALIHNSSVEDKGTIYVPDNPEKMLEEWK